MQIYVAVLRDTNRGTPLRELQRNRMAATMPMTAEWDGLTEPGLTQSRGANAEPQSGGFRIVTDRFRRG